jgi:hypothetical protein
MNFRASSLTNWLTSATWISASLCSWLLWSVWSCCCAICSGGPCGGAGAA